VAAGRLLVAAPLIALFAWAAVEALDAARADGILVEVRRAYQAWPANSPPADAVWRSAWRQLELAERAQKGNPVTQEYMGLLAARRTDDLGILRQADDHFARSLALRPISPNTWANLAEAKYLEGETSAIFEAALSRASRLGPAQPHVQRMVAHYGLAVWDEVSPSTREAIDGMLAAGMRRDPLEMLQIAKRRDRLSTACRHLAGVPRQPEPKWVELCQSTEARR
jgi:tetratricopeptide (TPR) repeat protein